MIPEATIAPPFVDFFRPVKSSANRGISAAPAVAVRIPALVLATKFVTSRVSPPTLSLRPPLCAIEPARVSEFTTPPVIGNRMPPPFGAAGAMGATFTFFSWRTATAPLSNVRTEYLPFSPSCVPSSAVVSLEPALSSPSSSPQAMGAIASDRAAIHASR